MSNCMHLHVVVMVRVIPASGYPWLCLKLFLWLTRLRIGDERPSARGENIDFAVPYMPMLRAIFTAFNFWPGFGFH